MWGHKFVVGTDCANPKLGEHRLTSPVRWVHDGWPSSNVTPVGDPSQELGAGQLQRLALPMLGLDMERYGK